ncbi:hypothetical protein AL036_07615 [Salipiger aestuarii]|uniref:Lipoprotein n=1 Tax=Salipiger aestuarii TaxID=568098 RepID=A0A327Y7M4_9RHOB|nr:hypothetical protein [Salipiger aestuarii]EIE51894.1 putative lipoprotein [Citreicella sp. 357]KAA8608330.1 hypothetical protein AL036_07615 [Salipiger aestuarii]KAA8612887.1 hypothetical protein AL037_07130 [Salipiger aestuarii]KAB2542203.1 hypothetical protein AL035_08300 [Salipiger aestuarii]RAK16824.1 hypothetical protein ATI53_101841 [Salipiger aestuarii]
MIRARLIPLAALSVLSACEPSSRQELPFVPDYQGVETRLLDGDLVSFLVEMRGARDTGDVEDYANCVAAQYALIRGYGFARHVRTNVAQEGGLWRGDAVYTISAALPRGLKTIDAEVVALACAENGIPMV